MVRASSSASTQKAASRVRDTFQESDVPAVPVHDRREVDEALPHGDVGDIGTEDLVGSDDVQTLQEIGIDRDAPCWADSASSSGQCPGDPSSA